MTVTTDKTKDKVNGTGGAGPYSFSGIKLINPEVDLQVAIEDANGNLGNTLIPGVNYTIDYNDSTTSFDINFLGGLTVPLDNKVFVNRLTPILQPIKISESGEINTRTYEAMNDRVTLQNQDQKTLIDSSFRLKPNVTEQVSLELDKPIPGRAVIGNSTGDGLEYSDVDLADLDQTIADVEQERNDAVAAANTATSAANSASTSASNAAISAQEAADSAASIDPAKIESNRQAIGIELPANYKLYYGGSFDASKQFTVTNASNVTFDYSTNSYTGNGSSGFIFANSEETIDVSGNDTVFQADYTLNALDGGIIGQGSTEGNDLAIDVRITAAGKFLLNLSSNGSTRDIAQDIPGTHTVATATDYLVKVYKTPTTWNLDYSLDEGQNWVNDITVNSTLNLYGGGVRAGFMGALQGGDVFMNGTLRLKNTFVYSRGKFLVKAQDMPYELNKVEFSGTVRNDDNTINIEGSAIRSPLLTGQTAYSQWYLFVGKDNTDTTVLEWDSDINGSNLSTITGVKRRIGDNKSVTFPVDGSGNLAYFERNFGTWEFDLWNGSAGVSTITLNNGLSNYSLVQIRDIGAVRTLMTVNEFKLGPRLLSGTDTNYRTIRISPVVDDNIVSISLVGTGAQLTKLVGIK